MNYMNFQLPPNQLFPQDFFANQKLLGNNPTSVILLKKIPQGISEQAIRSSLKSFGQIITVKLLVQKLYAYVEFDSPLNAQMCVNYFQENEFYL